MPAMDALLTGFGLGFLVGAQVGPIWLLCVRSTLRSGFAVGASIGAGAALVDTLYAAAGVAGASAVLEIDALRIALGLIGAGVLAWLGARSLWTAFRVRLGGEALEEVGSPRRAFLTATAATASNPLTIASWGAIFSAASTAAVVDSPGSALAMLAGVGLGSLAWFLVLSGGLAVARRRVGPGLLRTVEAASGLGLLGFAGLLSYRTLRA
jgi:putative LysE/RhtB family amino acid efflux pump